MCKICSQNTIFNDVFFFFWGVGGWGGGGGVGGVGGGFMYFPWHNVVTHQPLEDALELMIFKLVSKLDILSIFDESGLK